jgi:hypothetical protein
MFIYAIENRLFIHSNTILHTGYIEVLKNNKRIKKYTIDHTEFFSCQPDLEPDYYLIRVYEGNQKIDEKRVFLTNKIMKIQR